MIPYFVLPLRLACALVVLVGLFGQFVVVPGVATAEAERFPPYAPYAVPYGAAAIAGILCVQVAVVAVWVLLSMLRRDALFSPRAFRWVDVIIGATVAATLVTGSVTVHMAVAEIPGGSMEMAGTLALSLLVTGSGVVLTMVLVLMRGLLRKATDLQTEMAQVV